MDERDTPPGRLLRVFERFSSQGPKRKVLHAWADVFSVSARDTPALLSGIVDVHRLAQEAEDAVRALNSDIEEMLLRWRAPVATALGAALEFDAEASAVSSHVGPTAIHSLEFADVEIYRATGESRMDDDAHARALLLADELLEMITASTDLAPRARALLLRQAAALKASIEREWLVGGVGVQAALAGAVGATIVISVNSPETQHTSSFKKFVSVVAEIGGLLTVAQAGVTLGTAIAGLIGG